MVYARNLYILYRTEAQGRKREEGENRKEKCGRGEEGTRKERVAVWEKESTKEKEKIIPIIAMYYWQIFVDWSSISNKL